MYLSVTVVLHQQTNLKLHKLHVKGFGEQVKCIGRCYIWYKSPLLQQTTHRQKWYPQQTLQFTPAPQHSPTKKKKKKLKVHGLLSKRWGLKLPNSKEFKALTVLVNLQCHCHTWLGISGSVICSAFWMEGMTLLCLLTIRAELVWAVIYRMEKAVLCW